MNNRVWITWEHQTRNISMAKLLDCRYFELTSSRSAVIRYIVLTCKTLKLLINEKPNEIFFQNPSILLAGICAFYKILNNKKTVVGDYHNAALEPSSFFWFNSFVSRIIDLTIVSNANLIPVVELMKGRAFVMPDPIPNNHHTGFKHAEQTNEKYVVFICSWASDEPILTVLNAFIASKAFKEKGISLYVTGQVRPEKLEMEIDFYIGGGIKFLGFVPEEMYWDLISNSEFNIDLTTRNDCLVCGAYESISVGNIVILSNNNASTTYFGEHCIYTDNSVDDLKNKIIDILLSKSQYKEAAKNAKTIFVQEDEYKKQSINKILNR